MYCRSHQRRRRVLREDVELLARHRVERPTDVEVARDAVGSDGLADEARIALALVLEGIDRVADGLVVAERVERLFVDDPADARDGVPAARAVAADLTDEPEACAFVVEVDDGLRHVPRALEDALVDDVRAELAHRRLRIPAASEAGAERAAEREHHDERSKRGIPEHRFRLRSTTILRAGHGDPWWGAPASAPERQGQKVVPLVGEEPCCSSSSESRCARP
jgi:hypothetical protein